jgi:arylsulfatase A-like enzyme
MEQKSRRTVKGAAILKLIILIGFFTLFPWGSSLHGSPQLSPGHFNILLITVDTLRADHLSCYGYRNVQTRNMDSLSARGVWFDKALSPSPWTAPSVASIMTSVYPSVHGVRKGVALDSGFTTLAEILMMEGFRTHAIVTNPYAIVTNPYLSEDMNLNQGFAGYEFLGSNPISKFLLNLDSAEVATEKAIKWLRNFREERFFLWLHYNDPHIPYGFPGGTVLPAYGRDYQGDLGNHFYAVRAIRDGSLKLSDKDKRHIQALYDADVLYVDTHLGLLFSEMNRLGIMEKTIIVLTSDHGEEFWDHNGFEHGHSLYGEVIRVPLIMVVPGMDRGPKKISQQVRLIDLAPTILAILGIQEGKTIQGKSLLPLMMDGKDVFDRTAFSGALLYGNEKKAIRNENFTLIYELETGNVELYDIVKDPLEKEDVALHNQETVDGLLSDLERKLKEDSILSASIPRKDSLRKIDLKEHENKLRELGYVE